ncbi:MAG: dockerin type I domain-containing protein [Clostridia bacterium]
MSKKILKRIVIIALIFIMLTNILIVNKSFAAETKKYTQIKKSGIEAFPESYQSYLIALKEQHPNWNFEAYYTGITWDELVANEIDHGHNRIIKSADSLWRCSCNDVQSGYACASESIIKYYMDPRNFIKNDVLIFQFLEMTYNSNVQNKEGVESILKNTFMNAEVEIEGKGKMSYADIIMEAAKQSNMSPYSIATKIIQEVGSIGSESVSGTYAGYEGYYNFFNYGANDEGSAVSNGLAYARSNGWNNQYIAIIEGAKLLANDYTNAGQNTAYFYKWDVVGNSVLTTNSTCIVSSDYLFRHQYMTNVQDPTSQTSRLYNTYLSNDILDASLNFIIPVYDNMPDLNKLPTTLTAEDGELYYSVGEGVYVRSGPGTNYTPIGFINTLDEVVAMQERETSTDSSGMKWDKVKLSNGIVGYVASKYLKPCATQDYNNSGTNVDNSSQNPSNSTDKVKIEENDVIAIPNLTVENLASELNIINYQITKDGKIIENNQKVGTGYIIKDNDTTKEYTIIVKGDINGDGEVDTGDTYLLKLVIMQKKTLDEENSKNSADINNDGYVDTGDSFILKKYVMKVGNITL